MTHTNTEAPAERVTREDAIKFLEGACRNWSKVPKLSEDDIGDVASELLRFALSRRSASNTGGVEVKELVWQKENVDGTFWTGVVAISGQYDVKHGMKGWQAGHRTINLGWFETCDEAKAACQADFNQRILSAISLAAEAEPVAYSEAETWCRLTGKALDALDAISCWEVEQDDEDAAGQMAEFAEKATVEIRAAYPELTHPSSSVSAEVTVTDEMVELALRRWFGESWPNAVPGDLDGVFDDMRATLKASINGGRENG